MAVARRLSTSYPRAWSPRLVPTFPVEIDRGHPLALGLVLPTYGDDFSTVGGVVPAVSPFGPVDAYNGSTGYKVSKRLFNLPYVSMGCWINVAAPPATNGQIAGFCNGIGNSAHDKTLRVQATFGEPNFYVFSGSGASVDGPASVCDGLWHHVLATHSPVSGLILYVDGAAVAQNAAVTGASYTGYTVPNVFINGTVQGTTWVQGDARYLAAQQFGFTLHDHALSASEVAWLAAEPFGMLRPKVRRTFSFPSALPPITGAIAATESSDTIVASGALLIRGALAASEGADTIIARGELGPAPEPPVVVPRPVGGGADARRAKWLAWAADRKKRQARKVEPEPVEVPLVPAPRAKQRNPLPSLPDRLLDANLRAIRVEDVAPDPTPAVAASLRAAIERARQQEEDDIEMLLLLG